MRRVAVIAAALAIPLSAHAMGSDRISTLLAWNRDGTAALIEQPSYRDGDHALGYTVVAVGAKPVTVSISNAMRFDSKDNEQIADTDCATAAKQLASALATNHLTGVDVHADQCKNARRAVVTVAADTERDVEQSWVALPQGRTPTAREQASWDIVKQASPTYQPFVASIDCNASHEAIDVANKTGKLVLLFSSTTCNSPTRITVTGFVPKGAAYEDAHLFGD